MPPRSGPRTNGLPKSSGSCAETEAAAIVESARQQGREMLDEARAARERVLVDLGRRRNLLQAQVEELRQGRDRLLDAYRVVKRTFLDATEALAQVEARAVSGRTLSPEAGEAPSGSEMTTRETAVGVPLEASVEEVDTRGGAALADVDSLFARIRAGHHEPAVADDAAAAPGADAAERTAGARARRIGARARDRRRARG